MLNTAVPLPHQSKHWLQLGPVYGKLQVHVEQVESIVPLPLQSKELAAVVLHTVQDPLSSLLNTGLQVQLQLNVGVPLAEE